jgi:hypothetical protein
VGAANDLNSKLQKHVLDQHRDEGVVFDADDAASLLVLMTGLHS